MKRYSRNLRVSEIKGTTIKFVFDLNGKNLDARATFLTSIMAHSDSLKTSSLIYKTNPFGWKMRTPKIKDKKNKEKIILLMMATTYE